MKKIFSCGLMLAASLTMMAGVVSQTIHTNEMNPYAYGVKAEVEDGVVAITYQLNAPATSSEIVIYRDGEEVRTQPCEDNSIGLKAEVVDLSEETVGGTYTFGVRVYGTSVEAPTQLVDATDPNNPVATCYGFDHPKAVDVDVNPFSPNFGRILACEALSKAGTWWSEGKCGVYAFDPTFASIPNGNDRAFTGDVALASYAPYRLRITKDGRIFATSLDINGPVMWEISADLQTWTPVFSGTMSDNFVVSDAEGNFIAASNSGLDVDGEGEDLQIHMLGYQANAKTSFSANDAFYARYDLGTATSWAEAPSHMDTLSAYCPAVTFVHNNCNIASDHNGGFWFKAARGRQESGNGAVQQHAMFHVNANGVVDWDLAEKCVTEADSLEYGINYTNGNNGGAGIRMVGDMLIAGTGRESSGKGKFIAWKVSADAAGAPVLTKLYTYEIAEISTNLNDFAVDYANNLFVVGNSNEKLCVVMLPYSGNVTTPVKAEVVVEGTAVENVEAIQKAEKVIENGQLIIIKNGVRYNALGVAL